MYKLFLLVGAMFFPVVCLATSTPVYLDSTGLSQVSTTFAIVSSTFDLITSRADWVIALLTILVLIGVLDFLRRLFSRRAYDYR